MGENFGRFGGLLLIHQSFICQNVVRFLSSNMEWALPLPTAKVFSTNFLAVPILPQFSPTKVLCYTVLNAHPLVKYYILEKPTIILWYIHISCKCIILNYPSIIIKYGTT